MVMTEAQSPPRIAEAGDAYYWSPGAWNTIRFLK